MKFVLLTSDLMLVSSAQGAADRHGATLVSASNSGAALAACGDDEARILAIDLRLAGIDLASLVTDVRALGSGRIHVLACGPHVHERSLAAAVAAGCDEVVTRGEFDRRVDAALGRLALR